MNGHIPTYLRGVLLLCAFILLAACSQAGSMTTVQAPTIPPQAAASPTPVTPPSDVETALGALQGLSFDEFIDKSYTILLLRDPERITYEGLYDELGMANNRLNDLSEAYTLETHAIQRAILEQLRSYDVVQLTQEQQTSWEIYEWWLDDLVQRQAFLYYDYAMHHFLGNYHENLVDLFADVHPMDDAQDAEDYLARLGQIETQVDQLIEGLDKREQLGVVPPLRIMRMTTSMVYNSLGIRSPDPAAMQAQSLPFYTTFVQRLGEVEGLNHEAKQAMAEEALQIAEASIVPAYSRLLQTLELMQDIAGNDIGVWRFPEGDAYYTYLLHRETSTDLSANEIHTLGLEEVTRIQAELQQVFSALGYPEDAPIYTNLDRAREDAGYMSSSSKAADEAVIAAYEAMYADIQERMEPFFDIGPQAELIVVGEDFGGYYTTPAADGSRPGIFHAGLGGAWVPRMSMATIAYHEGIPGHHYQLALAQELDLPLFRRHEHYNGFIEGWALYAERLAWELGAYEDNPYGNIGRLELELLRAVRLVVDTGIHAFGWTYQEADSYMMQNLGYSYEIDRYTVMPAQATGYKVGMLDILAMRQKAMDALGDQFSMMDFHTVALENGSVPLAVFDEMVERYIAEKLGSG